MKLKILAAILIILLPFVIFMANFKFLMFNDDFYREEFAKYGVYEVYPEADELHELIFSYLQSDKELSKNFFLRIEADHLNDVKNLIASFLFWLKILMFLFLLLTVALLFFTKKRFIQQFSKVLFFGSILSVILLAFFSLSLIFFDFSFTVFHEMLFENDFWMLPLKSVLVNMYPEMLFQDFALKFLLNSLITSIAALLLGTAGLLYKKEKFFKL